MYFHIQNTRKGVKNMSQSLVAFDKFTVQKRILYINVHFLIKSENHPPKVACRFQSPHILII